MRLKLAVFMTFLILLAACKPATQQSAPINTQVGTQGITLSFLTNSPPTRVYDDSPENLDFLIDVKNKGTYTLKPREMLAAIGGYDGSIIRLDRDYRAELATSLEGKSQFNPDGGEEVLEWKGTDITLPGEVYQPNFQVTACYHYETAATPGMCIDPRPRNVIPEKKACILKDVALGGGQGAPIAVTKVEEDVLSNRVQFKIYVQNVGGGDEVSPDVSLDECMQSPLRLDAINKVGIIASVGNNVALTCTPNNDLIRLTNNQGFIICYAPFWFDPTKTPAFTTALNIKLVYGYKTSIQKQVEIRKTPT